MTLPAPVQTVIDAYLEAADSAAPGLIEGLYLVGSVALGNFRPHGSDIDFVAVTARPPDGANLASLEQVHVRLHAQFQRPYFDGVYVTWEQLAQDPALAGSGPCSHESRFHADESGERHPVTWHTLAHYGLACRGPVVAEVPIWQDRAQLAAWTDGNLDSYWRRLVDRGSYLFTPYGLGSLTAWACAWTVLGVSRLHYTLATGDITSKEGAGLYGLQNFPSRWHTLLEEALRIHRASGRCSLYRSPLARRRDLLTFADRVIIDAHRLYAAKVNGV